MRPPHPALRAPLTVMGNRVIGSPLERGGAQRRGVVPHLTNDTYFFGSANAT
jgi:hypothetical protein